VQPACKSLARGSSLPVGSSLVGDQLVAALLSAACRVCSPPEGAACLLKPAERAALPVRPPIGSPAVCSPPRGAAMLVAACLD